MISIEQACGEIAMQRIWRSRFYRQRQGTTLADLTLWCKSESVYTVWLTLEKVHRVPRVNDDPITGIRAAKFIVEVTSAEAASYQAGAPLEWIEQFYPDPEVSWCGTTFVPDDVIRS